ncbi:MAG: hypothetical protein KJ063_16300 [Anaerolineae bacterium]|nr:hypothetical protein [Anaerolineae bacterium]
MKAAKFHGFSSSYGTLGRVFTVASSCHPSCARRSNRPGGQIRPAVKSARRSNRPGGQTVPVVKPSWWSNPPGGQTAGLKIQSPTGLPM